METVGDILAELDGAAPPQAVAEPIDIEGWPGPSIVFGMPDDEYHRIPALSASGMKALAASPMDFWARSWMNPRHDPADDESPFKELGMAYHARILEGAAAFRARYAPALHKSDYPLLLDTMDDLRAACAALGVKPGASKASATAALLACKPWVPIWNVIETGWAALHAGKTLLPAEQIERIEVAAAMIERHPQLSLAFVGGFPEVAIFWRCAETGVPMKAKIDYWKPRAIVDLKSIGNPMMTPLIRAIYRTVAQRRYYTQAAVYLEAVEAAKAMLRSGYKPEVWPGAEGPERAWLDTVAAAPEPTFLLVFQQTGPAPVAQGVVLPAEGAALNIGRNEARMRKEAFALNWRTFGTDPWVGINPIENLLDEEFPPWMGAE